MKNNKNKNGIIIYQGKSQLSRQNIIAVATGFNKSKNPKTGKMMQVFIERSDINPFTAYSNNRDFSVCGNCKMKKYHTCYVNKAQAPNQIFRAFHRNRYEILSLSNINRFKGHSVRFGAFGEPTAVPIKIWNYIIPLIDSFTSYTHQWKNPKFQEYKNICMASVDSEKEYLEAKKLGWRTFRVRSPNMKVLKNEIICPASEEGGEKLTCLKCGLCCGTSKKAKDITIIAHGRFKNKLIKLLESEI